MTSTEMIRCGDGPIAVGFRQRRRHPVDTASVRTAIDWVDSYLARRLGQVSDFATTQAGRSARCA